jgi:hypothetical protein
VSTLAASKVRLMMKALMTQFSSMRPLSMNQNGRLGKEGGAAMGCDGDQIDERGTTLFCDEPAAWGNKREANG